MKFLKKLNQSRLICYACNLSHETETTSYNTNKKIKKLNSQPT